MKDKEKSNIRITPGTRQLDKLIGVAFYLFIENISIDTSVKHFWIYNLAKVWPVFALIIVARATLTSENSTLLGDPMKAEGKTLGREIPVKISIFLTSAKDVKRSDPFVQQIPRQGRQFSGSSQLLQYDLNLHLLCVLVTSPAITQYLIRCPCPGFSSRTNRLFFAFLNIGGSVFYPQKDRVVVKDEHLKR
ncbi:3402_t:CDS:2 [Entrophospora sp. SA101]|nr:3402_t:CDS:2 [Entrophospora sp. SA101]